MCQTTVIFGITKDESLVLNTLASWNGFTCRNLFQYGANDMSEEGKREKSSVKSIVCQFAAFQKWAQLELQKKTLELLANYNILQHVIKTIHE